MGMENRKMARYRDATHGIYYPERSEGRHQTEKEKKKKKKEKERKRGGGRLWWEATVELYGLRLISSK